MTPLCVASLVVNIAVLLPVCASLGFEAPWVRSAFGPRHPGRQILLAIYSAILGVSASLLAWPNVEATRGLLLVQVVYKLLTPMSVGTVRNPVVASNLAIAVLHAVTLASLG